MDSEPRVRPIPITALATSHVDQLSRSPPQPHAAFSPSSLSPISPSFPALSLPFPASPPLSPLEAPSSADTTPAQSPDQQHQDPYSHPHRSPKPHPADLATLSNRDPHRSPPPTPDLDRLASPVDSVNDSDVDRFGEGERSENGVNIGHGSEESGVGGEEGEREEVEKLVRAKVVEGPAQVPLVEGEKTVEKRAGRKGERRDREREKERENGRERESTRSRRVLGEWSMSKTLGAGSMGKVKLGISSITGEKVAIKIIPRFTSTAAANRAPSSSNGKTDSPRKEGRDKEKDVGRPSASFLAKAAAKDASKEVRTTREGSICLLLHHPYVCGMKTMFVYPNHYYMVFEYVNGGQMLDYIISHGRLRERSARKFARQIGSALEYCHANSIVHRDLKIENILISKTGNIKIIDFGLSNLYSPVSQLSTFCGSLYFAAPELLNAKLYTGPEVDVWSFGIVLYVLVCGKVPFDDQSMPALHAKIKRGQVEYPTWLSAECKSLLARMLVTNPAQRATLHEVANHPWMLKGFTGPPSAHLPPRVPLRLEELDREVIKGMIGFEFGTEESIEANLVEVFTSDLYRTAVRSWEAKMGGGMDEDEKRERPSTRVDGKDMKGLGRSPTNKRFSGLGFYGKKLAGGFNAAFAGSATSSKEDGDGLSNGAGTLVGGGKVESLDPTKGFHPLLSIYYLVKEKMEREKIWGPGVFASSTLSLNGPPPPPAPAQAYQSGTGLVSPLLGEPLPKSPVPSASADAPASTRQPIGSPRLPLTPQPRQRATGEGFPPTTPSAIREPPYTPTKRSSFHPSASAPASPLQQQFRPTSTYETSAPTVRDRRSVHIMSSTGQDRGEQSGSEDVPLGSPSQSSFARRFGSLLGRSAPSPDGSYVKGHRQRASIGGTAHKASNKTAVSALPQVSETLGSGGSDVPLPSPSEGQGVHRASTVGELSPNRHQRGASMGAGALFSGSVGRATGSGSERKRQISLGPGENGGRPHTAGAAAFDERAEEVAPRQQEVGFVGRTALGSEQAKPVWLKGLFSVSTTTTKPIAALRNDLVAVLDRLGVQYREVKGGYECAHVPSIDLSSIGGGKDPQGEKETLSLSSSPSGKATLRRKASKLLGKDLPSAPDDSQTSLGVANDARDRTTMTSSTSFTVLQSDTNAPPMSPTTTRTAAKFNSSTAEGSTVTSDLIVRFEIFIVKMPLLPGIHGLQFRRIGGNGWQYQMLARRVLQGLKL